MILQSLAAYYDVLVNDPDSGVAKPGFSDTGVSSAIVLNANGELVNIIPTMVTLTRGNKQVEVPQRMMVPARVKRSSGVNPNLFCDNATYVLGLMDPKKKDPDYAKVRFESFKNLHLQLIVNLDSPFARAFRAFLNNWEPGLIETSLILQEHMDELLKGGNLVFLLDGQPGYLHQQPEFISLMSENKGAGKVALIKQCLVTGDYAPVARLHSNITGIKGANSTGATLVGFNANAFESYNLTQGENSPVSESAMFAYTTALNYLTSKNNPHRPLQLGDMTVVYWAESTSPLYADIFEALLDPGAIPTALVEGVLVAHQAERLLESIASKIADGKSLEINALAQELDPNTQFYVLGISPNVSRLFVRLFEKAPFGEFLSKLEQHHQNLRIIGRAKPASFWSILNETVSPKVTKKAPAPLLGGAVLRSVLMGLPYPATLLSTIITRVKTDQDEPKRNFKINPLRAGIIKACLLHKYQHFNQSPIKEVLAMSLNPESNYQAYVLGRLFALLEKAQLDAAGGPGKLNTTIKDRYFGSACASPGTVFPTLLKLAQHHIAKAKYGRYLDKDIEQIMKKLELEQRPFPAHLSLDDQGVFILGYYHQRASFYEGKNQTDDPTTDQSPVAELE